MKIDAQTFTNSNNNLIYSAHRVKETVSRVTQPYIT